VESWEGERNVIYSGAYPGFLRGDGLICKATLDTLRVPPKAFIAAQVLFSTSPFTASGIMT
jgi:hypothetical protein